MDALCIYGNGMDVSLQAVSECPYGIETLQSQQASTKLALQLGI